MSTQMPPKRWLPSMGRLALAAIGISFFVASASTLGADRSTAAPAPATRHATSAHPADPPSSNGKTSATFVDQLYKELMEWTPAGCASAASEAPLRGHC